MKATLPSTRPVMSYTSCCRSWLWADDLEVLDDLTGVDADLAARDVAGLVGGQPEHRVGDVARVEPGDRQGVHRREAGRQRLARPLGLGEVRAEQRVGLRVLDHAG